MLRYSATLHGADSSSRNASVIYRGQVPPSHGLLPIHEVPMRQRNVPQPLDLLIVYLSSGPYDSISLCSTIRQTFPISLKSVRYNRGITDIIEKKNSGRHIPSRRGFLYEKRCNSACASEFAKSPAANVHHKAYHVQSQPHQLHSAS